VFTSRPTFLLACKKTCVFLYGIYVFTQHINIVSIDEQLMRSIQIQSFLIFLDLPNGIIYTKVAKPVYLVRVEFQ